MKSTNKILAIALVSLFFASCNDKKVENITTEVVSETLDAKQEITFNEANLQTASFIVDGMHCEFGCAKSLEKKLNALDGVKSASIDFESKQAKIEFDATMQTPELLAKVVEGAADGKTYKVSNVVSSSDQSTLYYDFDQEKKSKKETKKSKETADKEASNSSTDAPKEKKACCSKGGEKSCSKSENSGTL